MRQYMSRNDGPYARVFLNKNEFISGPEKDLYPLCPLSFALKNFPSFLNGVSYAVLL